MISMQTLIAPQLPAWRTPLRDPLAPAADNKSPGLGLPSLSEMRDIARSMRRELAAKQVQAVRERRDALMLMVKIDPKAALKLTAELAKALKQAVKDFVDAGGKNPTMGEMKMMARDAQEAREAADAALEGLPVEAMGDGDSAKIDAEIKRAQAAYATAFGVPDDKYAEADRLEAVVSAAVSDSGFFDQVKAAMGELKAAREKIKANWAHPRSPNRDDWTVADKAMGDIEEAVDMAPTGAPEISDAPRVVTA